MAVKSYYSVIDANVRNNTKLSANAKLLYGDITTLCNKNGYCWATNEYFAKLYGVSKRSILRWLNELTISKYIMKELSYSKKNVNFVNRKIRLNIENTNLTEGSDKNVARGSDKNVARGSDKNVAGGSDKNVAGVVTNLSPIIIQANTKIYNNTNSSTLVSSSNSDAAMLFDSEEKNAKHTVENKNLACRHTEKTKNKKSVKKQAYGSFNNVLLTADEYKKLKNDFPCEYTDLITLLSEKIESYGYTKIISHFKNIYTWVLPALKEKQAIKEQKKNCLDFAQNSQKNLKKNRYATSERKASYDIDAYEKYSIFDDPTSEWSTPSSDGEKGF